jgi:hypothetical protein
VAVKTKRFKTELVTAVDSFVTSGLEDAAPFPVAAGSRWSRDHEVVRRCPQYFAEDGTPTDEIATLRTRLGMADVPAPKPSVPVSRLEQRIPDEQALVNVFNGERVRRGSKPAKENPGWYVPVTDGVKRSEALFALAPMTIYNSDGTVRRTVYAGQWCKRDDELVTLHPDQFTLPEFALREPEAQPTPTRTEA